MLWCAAAAAAAAAAVAAVAVVAAAAAAAAVAVAVVAAAAAVAAAFLYVFIYFFDRFVAKPVKNLKNKRENLESTRMLKKPGKTETSKTFEKPRFFNGFSWFLRVLGCCFSCLFRKKLLKSMFTTEF